MRMVLTIDWPGAGVEGRARSMSRQPARGPGSPAHGSRAPAPSRTGSASCKAARSPASRPVGTYEERESCRLSAVLRIRDVYPGSRILIFTQKIVTKLLKIWVWDPGSGIRKKPIPDPGSGSATLLIWSSKKGHNQQTSHEVILSTARCSISTHKYAATTMKLL